MRTFFRVKTVNFIFAITALAIVAWFAFSAQVGRFSNEGFMPHGHCYLWTPLLVWTMVSTDALIGLAYVSISICLYVLVRRIQLPFSAIFLAFGTFIAACGATHFMSIYTLWEPNYWLDALIKIITAVASVATAVILFPLFPKVVQLATTARLSEERKRQLEILNRELQAKTEQLLIVNSELEAFSYTVSHDLRSPLRGIDGFSQALLEDYSGQLDDKGQEYLRFVRTGAQRMGQIIDDVLNLSRLTRTDLMKNEVDVTALAKDIMNYLRLQDPRRSVQVDIQEGLHLHGDAGLFRILFENLLSNAWKFSSKLTGATIEVGETLRRDKRYFFVRDNGAGFDMKFSNKLFNAFQRLHTAEEFPGTGVGLASAKRIIDRHGGSIEAESEPGKGTTIYFTVQGSI